VRVALLCADEAAGAQLSSGLEAAGADVEPVAAAPADVAVGLRTAAHTLGGLDGVVDAATAWPTIDPCQLTELDFAGWKQRTEDPLRRALNVLQAAHRQLQDDGGAVVVVLPTLVLTGAALAVPLVTAAEGYRGLVKAAARTWGRHGVTVNCVCVPAALFGGASLDRDDLQPAALGVRPDLRATVAPVIAGLLDEQFRTVTGLTLAADGGVWMTP
jgi:NAD(P)-dependent dehydrogenase (short-subunit alcohol dehydrogenase family)